jgi:exonuclease III
MKNPIPTHSFQISVADLVDVKACNKNLKFYYFNARSLCNKLKAFELLLKSESYDFIMVTETWLNDKIADAEVLCGSSYKLLRYDRTKKLGGGVAVLYKNHLKVKLASLPEHFRSAELLILDLSINTHRLHFILCYRPPNLDTAAGSTKVDFGKVDVELQSRLCKVDFQKSVPRISPKSTFQSRLRLL